MLQAQTEDGSMITLASLPKETIARLRNHPFYCPLCKERVIVRAGKEVTAHFSHRKKTRCPSAAGGEGSYHASGKYQLYHWFKRQGLDPALEQYLPRIRQQPDVYLTIETKKVAVEFQCARIPVHTLHLRNRGYVRQLITPIWIAGANLFRRRGKMRLQIDAFLRQFIHQFSSEYPSTLFFFSPDDRQFAVFQHIYFIRHDQALGDLNFYSLRQLTLPRLLQIAHPSYSPIIHAWKKEKKHSGRVRMSVYMEKRFFGINGSMKNVYTRHTCLRTSICL